MEKAILAAIDLKDELYDINDLISECKELARALDIEIVAVLSQSLNKINHKTAFGLGKLEELKALVEEYEVSKVIFLNNLKVSTLSRVSEYLGVKVIDRTTLILDIFSYRAKSKEAKLQVEIARLKYDLPSILKENSDVDRSRGGASVNRGAGEMRSSLIRNKYKKRINELNEELAKIEKERLLKAKRRDSTLLKKVALVGYTNAGKSSLMNALVSDNKSVLSEDLLFATVDTDTRRIKYKNYEFLLYDTVGFISNLPTELIEAFKSTLSAAREADLILNVIDLSNKNRSLQKEVTLNVLKDIGANNIDIIEVYNKCDKKEADDNYPLMISATNNINIDTLLDEIIRRIYPNEAKVEGYISYKDRVKLYKYHNVLDIKELEYDDEMIKIRASGPKAYIGDLRKFLK